MDTITTHQWSSITYLALYSTTKYSIGQPPSSQELKWSVTLFGETSINFSAFGTVGFVPFVLVFRISDASPVPILQDLG